MKTKTNFFNIISKTTLFLVVATLVIFLSSYILSQKTKAAATDIFLAGYIYSENIGWIDFQPHNGGDIYMDDAGNVFGYAWSENIGWLKFGGLTGFPTGFGTTPSNAKKVGSNIVGWARACAGMYEGSVVDPSTPNNLCTGSSRTDGWDGWISLSGTATNAGNSPYGVTINTTNSTLSGFAWGSDVLGWIDFSPTLSSSMNLIDFYAFPPSIYKGQETKINWKTTGAKECTITKNEGPGDQAWGPGSLNATSGINVLSGVFTTTGVKTFKISCLNAAGTTLGPIPTTVTVTNKPPIIECNHTNVCKQGDPINWDPGDATGCKLIDVATGAILSTDPSTPIFVSGTVGDSITLQCDSPNGLSIPLISISDSGASGSGADCSITQPVDSIHPSANILYKDRKTTFGFVGGTPPGITWKVGNTSITGNTYVFTTIGNKTITGSGTVAGAPVGCIKTVNIKLDPGIGSGER